VLKRPLSISRIDEVDEVASLIGLAPPPPPAPELSLRAVTPEVADRVFFDTAPLQEMVDLLGEKKQLVFFGPPGTGKTLVAQALAEHLTANGGDWQLAQFHPSYSYEDFMEGYRPTASPDGAVSYELRQGPLRRIAADAQDDPGNPYVLIVDEINRGNIPKIFGELLFLLEYRDRPIALQYSDEAFRLPPNLFLIGTMNTADRSIALVDAALRRRFFFVPFLPREEPVRSVLRRWLEKGERDDLPARILDALNEKISKDEISIGPSYLMTGDGSDASLRRIWRHAIMPLLEEHYYGTKHDVEGEFGLTACLAAIAEPAADIDVPELSASLTGEEVIPGVSSAEPE
jgi:5-methylcytosine-specific restriction protein B